MANTKAASPEELRKARLARMASRTTKVADEAPKTEEIKVEEPAVVEPAPAPVAVENVVVEPAVEEQLPEELTAPVIDPADVSKAAEVSLHLFNEKSSDPHWLVCAGGQPVAQIRLSDQEEPDQLARVFTTDAYAKGVVEASSKMDLVELLSDINARTYVASVAGSTAFKAIEQQVKSASTEELRKTKSTLRDDMINALSLVVVAQSKNYISANSLKHALFNRLAATGMEEDRAVAAIEGAWQEGASEYFNECFKQAMKWMDLTPEAYAEVSETIQGMPQRTPTLEVEAEAKPRNHNVPLMTYTAGAQDSGASEHDTLRDALGLRSRHYRGLGA